MRNIGQFSRFLEAISFAHGGLLNITNLSRDCAVGRKSAEGYVEILEDLLLAFRLPVFRRRAGRRVTAAEALPLRRRRLPIACGPRVRSTVRRRSRAAPSKGWWPSTCGPGST